METFRDRDKREWSIDLTIGLVRCLKKATQFNLYAPDEPVGAHLGPDRRLDLGLPGDLPPHAPSLQQVLWTDLSMVYELLWSLCEEQAVKLGLSAVDFVPAPWPPSASWMAGRISSANGRIFSASSGDRRHS